MADILLSNGDIDVSPYADLAIVQSYDEITQSAINNILTIYGENQFHPDIGNMVHNKRLKISKGGLATIIQDCSNAIMQDDRVAAVKSLTAEIDPDNNTKVNITFTLMAVDGTLLSSMIAIYPL